MTVEDYGMWFVHQISQMQKGELRDEMVERFWNSVMTLTFLKPVTNSTPMNEQHRTTRTKALACGSELLNCILHDSRTWMKILGPGISKQEARHFLVHRIYQELEKA